MNLLLRLMPITLSSSDIRHKGHSPPHRPYGHDHSSGRTEHHHEQAQREQPVDVEPHRATRRRTGAGTQAPHLDRAHADPSGSMGVVARGEVWRTDFGEPTGSEPGYLRPALVISSGRFSRSRTATVIVSAFTSNMCLAAVPGNIELAQGEAGLPKNCVVNVSKHWLLAGRGSSTALATCLSAFWRGSTTDCGWSWDCEHVCSQRPLTVTESRLKTMDPACSPSAG